MLQLVVKANQTLKEFTENNYAQAAFFWDTLLREREIKVNGNRVSQDCDLYVGDTVTYFLTPKQEEKPAFYIAYEDENVLVVDKESGVNTEAVFAELIRTMPTCYVIHRLDRNTQGLMIFGKTIAAEEALLIAFKQKRVEKKYHALCFGTFPKETDILVGYLQKDAERSLVKIYDQFGKGEKIITEYRVLERREDVTKVEVALHTGKTHQIRAHLAHIGCPIVGDMKYGDTAKNKAKKRARQCLIAKSLRVDLGGKFAYLGDMVWTSRFEATVEKEE